LALGEGEIELMLDLNDKVIALSFDYVLLVEDLAALAIAATLEFLKSALTIEFFC
jgi:hypothetical protein